MQPASKVTILLIDDEAAHRKLIRRELLRDYPTAAILEAAELSAARELLVGDSAEISCVLIDLNLAGTSSLPLMRELQTKLVKSLTTLLAISTSRLESDIFEAYAAGAHCYLFKDSDFSEFSSNLRKALLFFLGRTK